MDQQFTGPFDFGLGVNNTGGVAQGFKPTQNNLVATDIFLTSNGANPSIVLTVNIRDGGPDGPVLGSTTATVPANTLATVLSPYVLHADFGSPIALTPGNFYILQVDPDGGFFGVAASYANGYPDGAGFQGTFSLPGLDWGFRTYYGEPASSGPQSKNDCKNGGWASFTTPRSFKNQGDCIQFVNTGK